MTLRLGLTIDADAAGATAAIDAAGGALDRLGDEARAAGAATSQTATAIDTAAADAERLATAATAAATAARQTGGALSALGANSAAAARQVAGLREQIDRMAGLRAPLAGRGDDVAAYGRSLDDLRARFSPLFALQRRYREELAAIRQAERVGAISAAESAAAIERTKAAFAGAVTAMRTPGGRPGAAGGGAPGVPAAGGAGRQLAPHEAAQLVAQMNDVAVSLAGGMNPLLVLLQQGSQIAPLFGGWAGAARAAAAALTPLRVGVAGLATAVVTGAVAWQGYHQSTKAVEVALAGVGRGSGATRAMLDEIAGAASAAGGITVREARAMEVALLRTGRIGARQFQDIISLSRDFGATLGMDRGAAGELLADLFRSPAEGARRLADEYGVLDGATARYVARLVAQSREEEARQVLLDALPARLADAATATTQLGRAWAYVSNQATNAWDAMGGAIDRALGAPTSAAERIAEIDREMEAIRRTEPNAEIRDAQLADLQRRRDIIAGTLALERERAELTRREDADRRAGNRAVDIAGRSPATETARRRRQLEDDIAALSAGLRAPDLTDDERADVNAAIEAKRRALESLRPAAERQAELDRLDVAIQRERDPVARAALAAARERVALAGEEVSAGTAAARVEAARTRVIEDARTAAIQAVRAGEDRIETLRAEIALAGADEATRRRVLALLSAEQQIRREGLGADPARADAIRAQAAASADLTSELERQRAAWGDVEGAVDGAVDALARGDFAGAAEAIRQLVLELTVLNPLKNWLTGGTAPTIGDVGTGGGVLGRILGGGGAPATPAGATPSAAALVTGMARPTRAAPAGVGDLFSYLRGQGLSDVQAAALLGNFQQESGFRTNAFNAGEGAFGMGQWRLDRRTGLGAFAAARGQPVTDPRLQLDWTLAEMRGPEARAGRMFFGAQDLGSANTAMRRYLRYGDASEATRLGYGQQLLGQFGGGGDAGGAGAASAALGRLAGAAETTTTGLGSMGKTIDEVVTGFDLGGTAGQSVGAMTVTAQSVMVAGGGGVGVPAAGGEAGGGGGIFGWLLGLMGFDGGGWTGGERGRARGIVHGEEFVVRAGPAARNRPLLEAINAGLPGYERGGWTGGSWQGSSAVQPMNRTIVNNYAGVDVEDRQSRNESGGIDTEVVLRAVRRDTKQTYGLRRPRWKP